MENSLIDDLLADIFRRKDGKTPSNMTASNSVPMHLKGELYRPNYQRGRTAPRKPDDVSPPCLTCSDNLDIHKMMRAYLR